MKRHSEIEDLCDKAFGSALRIVGDPTDVAGGRGTFSEVLRIDLEPASDTTNAPAIASAVCKLPTDGANRDAARRSGAYAREALAYRELLPNTPISTPRAYHVEEFADQTCALIMEDLSDLRRVDQLTGLNVDDATAVVESLTRFHRYWATNSSRPIEQIPIRRNTLVHLPDELLRHGLETLRQRWSQVIDGNQIAIFEQLVAGRESLATQFARHPTTVCHGDPRADNLVFNGEGTPVLFDWQQMAVQFGEADFSWLMATSLQPDLRRAHEFDIIRSVGGNLDRYRLGFALPGLAVLLLAQRELTTDRAVAFVATSLQRIATALDDLNLGR